MLSFNQLGGVDQGWLRGSGQEKLDTLPEEISFYLLSSPPHCNANRAREPSPPARLNMAPGKREQAEGYFREGQLPPGPQML